ncbi:MAG: hypothetical protein ACXWZS_02235, partial [Gemmatirosa sp.]
MPETSPAIDPLRLPAFTHALDAGHAAVGLSNLGQALARVGRWDDAEDALRRAAHARDALVHAGLGAPSVA